LFRRAFFTAKNLFDFAETVRKRTRISDSQDHRAGGTDGQKRDFLPSLGRLGTPGSRSDQPDTLAPACLILLFSVILPDPALAVLREGTDPNASKPFSTRHTQGVALKSLTAAFERTYKEFLISGKVNA
jgi:hypothetical protein